MGMNAPAPSGPIGRARMFVEEHPHAILILTAVGVGLTALIWWNSRNGGVVTVPSTSNSTTAGDAGSGAGSGTGGPIGGSSAPVDLSGIQSSISSLQATLVGLIGNLGANTGGNLGGSDPTSGGFTTVVLPPYRPPHGGINTDNPVGAGNGIAPFGRGVSGLASRFNLGPANPSGVRTDPMSLIAPNRLYTRPRYIRPDVPARSARGGEIEN